MTLLAQLLAKARGVANRDCRLNDNPGRLVHLTHGGVGGLGRGRVEEVLVRVAVQRRGDDGVVGPRVGLGGAQGYLEVKLALPLASARKRSIPSSRIELTKLFSFLTFYGIMSRTRALLCCEKGPRGKSPRSPCLQQRFSFLLLQSVFKSKLIRRSRGTVRLWKANI